MKKVLPILLVLVLVLLTGCTAKQAEETNSKIQTYIQIDQETAKEMMTRDDGHVIVDVRRQDSDGILHVKELNVVNGCQSLSTIMNCSESVKKADNAYIIFLRYRWSSVS